MKLRYRYSKSVLRSRLFEILLLLISLTCGYIRPSVIECDWSVQRLSCPPYATTDWDCLQTRLNCTNGEKYHCLRDGSGEWTEICAKPTTCSKGQEPVLKNSQIVCTKCKNPERYEPVEGTESYKYSECRRIKTTCPQDITHECPVDEAVRHSQDRQCRCDHKQDYMPQNYDLNVDTWICKGPDDLNCVHAPCPEDVYGNEQARGSDYRCYVPPYRSSTPSHSKGPSDRPSTVATTEKHTFSYIEDTETDDATSTKLLITLVLVVPCVSLLIAIFLFKAMPEGPIEVPETKIQYRQMGLAWQPPNIRHPETHKEPLVIHYLIEKLRGNTREWIQVTSTKETFCQVTGLEPGTFYNFRVRAQYGMKLSSSLTTQKMYQTKCLTVPEMPQGLTICEITKTYIALSWDPPAEDGGTPVTGYVVRYCNTSNSEWIKGQVLEEDITVWKQENLVKGNEYMFQVTAKNKLGESDPIKSENTVMLLREPGKPEAVSVKDITCNSVTLFWNAPEDDGGSYILYYHIRQKQEDREWENILKVRSGVFFIKVKKLKPEHTYNFGICAENEVGEGEYCDTTEPTKLPKRLGAPDSPLGPLQCLNVDYTELILSWKPPPYDGGFPVTHYKVEAKEPWIYSTRETIEISAETTVYHVKNLKDGTKYRFKLYAVNEKGSSDEALESEEIITKKIYPPDMPAGPLEVVDISDTEITLTWKLPKHDGGSPLTKFIVCKKEDSIFSKWDYIAVPPETTEYKFSGLKAGTAYKFRVEAQNRKDISTPVEVSCSTKKVRGPPGVPEGPLEAVDITEDALTLVWNKPQDDGGSAIERYRIAKKESWGLWNDVFKTDPEETRCRLSKLKKGTKYYFRVRAVNRYGSGDAIEKEFMTRTPKDRSLRQKSITSDKNFDNSTSAIHEAENLKSPEKDEAAEIVSVQDQKDQHDGRRLNRTDLSLGSSRALAADNAKLTPSHEVPEDTSINGKVSKSDSASSKEGITATQLPATDNLPIAGVPNIPSGPIEFSEVTANSVSLKWFPPEDGGNSPLDLYEVYETHDDNDWKRLEKIKPISTFYKAKGLKEGKVYKFSVIAKNKYGKGDRLVSRTIVPCKEGKQAEKQNAGTEVGEHSAYSLEKNGMTYPKSKQAVSEMQLKPNGITGSQSECSSSTLDSSGTGEEGGHGSDPVDDSKDSGDGALKRKDSSEELKKEKEAEDLLHELKSRNSWENVLVNVKKIKQMLDSSLDIPPRVVFKLQGKPVYKKGIVGIPHGFTAFESSNNGNSLYNSVSLILFGNESYAYRLRLASLIDGILNKGIYAQQLFNGKDLMSATTFIKNCLSETSFKEFDTRTEFDGQSLGEFVTKMTVRETAMPKSKCNPLQVQFLSTAIGFPIMQYFERRTQNFYEDLNDKPDLVMPVKTDAQKPSEGNDLCIHILWICEEEPGKKGKKVVNRVVPLIKFKEDGDTPV